VSVASDRISVGVRRHFTVEGIHPYDELNWTHREARIENALTGEVAFHQSDVEVPTSWSMNATNILAQKYFRGTAGTPEREGSLKQVVDRIAETIGDWGEEGGYFDEGERNVFVAELTHLLVNQRAAFNSPVWFNIGVDGTPNQASACFILSVDDTMDSILDWYRREGVIFKGGSGAGVNLSAIRGSCEGLGGGGTASGPVSFMRGADASAGTIKSGGKTRRAAKMVILDVDHPDIEEFVWCKAREERKARALESAGFDMSLNGVDIHSVQYQNANNSVRVTDEFMAAVEADADWALVARSDGSTTKTIPARELWNDIAGAAWECADPGVQFDTTINRWHTAPNTGPINASNPCSEYMHLDDSACNLSSINLLSFLDEEGRFDVTGYEAAIRIMFLAQEILVGASDYPTPEIADTARSFRQLGLGYANLGALLMAVGLPYDSDGGRAWAASLTALLTGQAYLTSAVMAARMGPFSGMAENREPMLRVLDQHRRAAFEIDQDLVPDELLGAARGRWEEACRLAEDHGVRNSQATVLAPTGTIALLMDCDTTGIEPDLGLIKFKRLVGGGTMSIVNQTLPRSLRRLGYEPEVIAGIEAHVTEHHSILDAPGLDPAHGSVFACAMGDNVIAPMGHVRMMAAAQPFLSGAISKTVNMVNEATADDIGELYLEAWRLGVKAVAIYRDNCKVAQPLSSGNGETAGDTDPALAALQEQTELYRQPQRQKLPRSRRSRTFDFRVADCKGFVTVGEYDDGVPGEIFVKVSKQGSTLAGIMDAFAISISYGLQYGVPLRAYVDTFTNMRFEPAGLTDDPDIRFASSLMDYLFRRLALEYLSYDERLGLGILASGERTQQTLPGVAEAVTPTIQGFDTPSDPPSIPGQLPLGAGLAPTREPTRHAVDAPLCMECGVQMIPSGACHACPSCGSTSGCS